MKQDYHLTETFGVILFKGVIHGILNNSALIIYPGLIARARCQVSLVTFNHVEQVFGHTSLGS